MSLRYSKGKVYKIYSPSDFELCYVGSTTQTLSARMKGHRRSYRDWIKGDLRILTTSFLLFEKYGLDNCIIELIENYPCESREELHRKEGEYVLKLNCINRVGRY